MKLALITDTHWGVRSDNINFNEYFKKSVDEFFFPELRKRGITNIIHLGDLVDRRKFINYLTSNRLRKDFLEPIEKEFSMDIIIGNHDTYYKNTNELNALRELVVGRYNNIRVFSSTATVYDYDIPILYVPWMCAENLEDTVSAIATTEAQICFGHLELQGFLMYKGHVSDHGFNSELFSRFDVVCSGHFHHKSTIGNINYLGSFCEFTWTDYNDPKGFHVFDTETRELEFVQNPFTMFEKIYYDDTNATLQELKKQANEVEVKGKYLKVVVTEKTNPYWFDLFVDVLESKSPVDIQIVEGNVLLEIEGDDAVDEAQDTITIFKNYFNQLNIDSKQKEPLEKVILDLYQEALNIQ